MNTPGELKRMTHSDITRLMENHRNRDRAEANFAKAIGLRVVDDVEEWADRHAFDNDCPRFDSDWGA